MEIRQLTIDEMDAIYNEHLVFDFPASEVKSMKCITEAYAKGKYFAWAMYNENKLVAYAFFIKCEKRGILLLDYLAVVRGQRGGGTGTALLLEIQKMCVKEKMNLILEVENPEYAESEEIKEYRKKRIRFYERNNMVVSDVNCDFYNNEYTILFVKDSTYNCPLQTETKLVYEDFFGKEFVNQHVTFH